ncbi:SDR family NAD(P)-dependent oxidoreductase [Chitinophaga niabensis]|uniref:NAD(P)-dependent dehydrogenase, short-chain alcohol dehydrogenase family n=1 Tax=Chitinophaga niabensis TaxID=536979 RepID=A0A1N6D0Z4_9BACT|nr:SDR family oxidoreductase [Chitinophaga niabensis]SIN64393.1 NAD(P)-dependent dehydrogenase, short-chain alcohol dehydrogenase family [Chitinophaga niabensis]
MALAIDLKDKIVIVTGSASGIGAGIAAMMEQAGAVVEGCDINAPRSVDVTDLNALETFVADVIKRRQRIDILVSCAGANVFEGVAQCTTAQWDNNIQLNLSSHWQVAKLCKPYLEQNGNGVIIIITSNHAYSTIPGCFPYNVAKTALTGLVRSLAIEWAPAIRTVGIAPGFIDTPGNQEWFNAHVTPDEEKARTVNLHPVKKLGTPEEIGAWCVFLASPFASFSTGTTYVIDGGRSALMQDS